MPMQMGVISTTAGRQTSSSEPAPSLAGTAPTGAARYEIGRFLGSGSFANVHVARDVRTRQRCAIKLIDVTACQRREVHATDGEPAILDILQREVDVHASVSSSRHPNVVTMLESFSYTNQTSGSHMMAMVLEHCPRGDLQGCMKRVRDRRKQQRMGHLLPEGTFLPANEIRHALSQLLCGLSFLHSRGIVHRDVKAQNIFLCPVQNQQSDEMAKGEQGDFSLLDCQLKLGDFGLAVQMREEDDWCEAQRTFCGTPSCLAPEVVSLSVPNIATGARPVGQSTKKKTELDNLIGMDASLLTQRSVLEKGAGYGQPSDLWSTGCLLYTMIAGRNPFAVPAPQPTTENQDPETQLLEKTKRMQQIIQRVMRGDWSLPANVRMEKPLDSLLHQLLDEQPRKRGTARGILNTHQFFKTDSDDLDKGYVQSSNDQHVSELDQCLDHTNDDHQDSFVEAANQQLGIHDSITRGVADVSADDDRCVPDVSQLDYASQGVATVSIDEDQYLADAVRHDGLDSEERIERDCFDAHKTIQNITIDTAEITSEETSPLSPAGMPQNAVLASASRKPLHSSGRSGNGLTNLLRNEASSDQIISCSVSNDERIKAACRDLAKARAAAAKVSEELLELRERKQDNSQDVLDMDHCCARRISMEEGDASEEGDHHRGGLRYIFNGRAGVLELDATSQFTQEDLVSRLEPLPYVDSDTSQQRRAEQEYKLGNFGAAQFWLPMEVKALASDRQYL